MGLDPNRDLEVQGYLDPRPLCRSGPISITGPEVGSDLGSLLGDLAPFLAGTTFPGDAGSIWYIASTLT